MPGPLSSPAGSLTSSTEVPPPSLLTATCAYPVLRRPCVLAPTVITLLPNPIGTAAENDPSGAAVVAVTADGAPLVASSDSMLTRAPGAVVPVTVVDVAASVLPLTGAVMFTVSAPGGPCATYRRVVNCGVSGVWPVASARISRSSWAWAQVSGDAEPAALPSVKPMEAVAGSLP